MTTVVHRIRTISVHKIIAYMKQRDPSFTLPLNVVYAADVSDQRICEECFDTVIIKILTKLAARTYANNTDVVITQDPLPQLPDHCDKKLKGNVSIEIHMSKSN